MGEGATGASSQKNKAGRGVGGAGTSKTRNRSGPYVPPSRRGGKDHHDRKKGTVTTPATSEGVPKGNTRPQKGRKPHGSTPKSRNNSKQKNFHNTRNHGGLKVYSSGDNDDSSGSRSSNKSFRQMHEDCKALRYKVHKPGCDCPKLLKMVEYHDSSDALAAVKLEDGRIDALVVVPDTKQKYVYVCRDTTADVFEDNPRGAEEKLKKEIFPTTSPVSSDVDGEDITRIDETSFKLSCASCLLKAHEPNGFCLIASSSADLVDTVRDRSRSNQRKREESGLVLHQDHAHFVARLPRSSLWNLHRSKTRAQKGSAVDEILGHLSNQDIDAVKDPEKFTNGIELGHHLLSVLSLSGRSDDFWFVMGYDDHKSLELDLPGGKRHLGETSLEGAIRETEEETSLLWDASWVTGVLQSTKRSDGGNRYFVLHPPQSLSECREDDQ